MSVRNRFKTDLFAVIFLLILATSLFLLNLGERSLWGSEGRWAEIAREMLHTSDFLTPKINGTPYRDKPVLSYYMILIGTPFTGGRVTELSARLPSATAAIAALFLLYSIGRKLFDQKTALFSSVILATSFFLVFWGRTASADVITMTGLLITLWIFVHFEKRPSLGWLYPFYLSMALNSLTKGLLGFALPMVVLIPYAWFRRRWSWIFNRHTLPAGILALFIYILPFLLEGRHTGSTDSFYLVFKENIIRFFAPFDHKEPFYYYFYEIFLIFAPWALFLPGALYEHFKVKKDWDDSLWFAILYFCALFIFFTISGSRRSYYLLPLFPAASLLVGKTLADGMNTPRPSWIRFPVPAALLGLFFGFISFLLFLRPSVLNPYEEFFNLNWYILGASLVAVEIVLAILLYMKKKYFYGLVIFVSAILTVDLSYVHVLAPEMESFRGLPKFCKGVREMRIPQDQLAVLHQWRAGGLYFYLDQGPIRRFEDPEEAMEFLSDSRNHLLIEAKDMPEIKDYNPKQIILKEPVPPFKTEDLNHFYLVRGREG